MTVETHRMRAVRASELRADPSKVDPYATCYDFRYPRDDVVMCARGSFPVPAFTLSLSLSPRGRRTFASLPSRRRSDRRQVSGARRVDGDVSRVRAHKRERQEGALEGARARRGCARKKTEETRRLTEARRGRTVLALSREWSAKVFTLPCLRPGRSCVTANWLPLI